MNENPDLEVPTHIAAMDGLHACEALLPDRPTDTEDIGRFVAAHARIVGERKGRVDEELERLLGHTAT